MLQNLEIRRRVIAEQMFACGMLSINEKNQLQMSVKSNRYKQIENAPNPWDVTEAMADCIIRLVPARCYDSYHAIAAETERGYPLAWAVALRVKTQTTIPLQETVDGAGVPSITTIKSKSYRDGEVHKVLLVDPFVTEARRIDESLGVLRRQGLPVSYAVAFIGPATEYSGYRCDTSGKLCEFCAVYKSPYELVWDIIKHGNVSTEIKKKLQTIH